MLYLKAIGLGILAGLVCYVILFTVVYFTKITFMDPFIVFLGVAIGATVASKKVKEYKSAK
jgi:hypothetical protein